ncbi:hypothetical protein BH24DEI2_BH24DEI2_07960 [soil metagenome]
MVKTLRESKAKLSELVELASQGEDVLITVRGKVKARLTRVVPKDEAADIRAWVEELKELQKVHSTGKTNLSIEQILSEDREDRF